MSSLLKYAKHEQVKKTDIGKGGDKTYSAQIDPNYKVTIDGEKLCKLKDLTDDMEGEHVDCPSVDEHTAENRYARVLKLSGGDMGIQCGGDRCRDKNGKSALYIPKAEKVDPRSLFKKDKVPFTKRKDRIFNIEHDESYLEYNPKDFPKNVRPYMLDVAKHHNLNFSSLVTYMMMTASNMIGNKVVLDVLGNGSWIHTPIIWGMNIAASGIGKTPAMSKLSAPNVEASKVMRKRHAKEMEKYDAELEAYNSKKDKEGTTPPLRPNNPMVMIDVITPEALYIVLEASEDGTMLWKDELADTFRSSERNENMRGTLLQAWSGSPISYVTKASGSNFIANPYIRIGGNIQPEVAKRIISDHKSGDKADGLFPRFGLICHLKSTGHKINAGKPDIFAKTTYDEVMLDLFREYRGAKIASSIKTLRLTPDVQLLLNKWIEGTREGIERDATSEHERGYLSKAPALLSSILVILHELGGGKKSVKESTVVSAINITEKAISNAFYLYDLERREEVIADVAEDAIEVWLDKTDMFEQHPEGLSLTRIANSYLNGAVTATQVMTFFSEHRKFEVVQRGRGFKVIGF